MSSVTLLDKTAFVQAAAAELQLTGIEHQVLNTIVFRLLGLDGAKPHNAWTTNGVLATAADTSTRTVRRILGRFEAWGILKRTSVAGRGGRIYLHVPGVQGAAKAYKADPLGDRTGEDNPSKTGQQCPVFAVEKRTPRSAKRGHRCPLSPIDITLLKDTSPLDGARGPAAEPPPAAAGQGFENDGGQKEGTLTRARARLLARLRGLAGKAGLMVGPTVLDHLGPDRVARWLRLQREDSPRASATLVREAIELLSDYLAVDPSDLAAAVATAPKAERKPKAKPEATLASSPPPKPPPRPTGARGPQRSYRPQAGEDDPLGIDRFAGTRKDMYDSEAIKASIARLNKYGPTVSNEPDPSEEKRRAIAEYMARLGMPTPSGPKP